MTGDGIEWKAVDDELELVRWRTERLRFLGYDVARAAVLACSAVDVHDLERLIARGCPLGTAVRIVA
jgi:hypothetical protein